MTTRISRLIFRTTGSMNYLASHNALIRYLHLPQRAPHLSRQNLKPILLFKPNLNSRLSSESCFNQCYSQQRQFQTDTVLSDLFSSSIKASLMFGIPCLLGEVLNTDIIGLMMSVPDITSLVSVQNEICNK